MTDKPVKIRIGKFDAATATVPVTFSDGANRHVRDVRAVLTDGAYDADATRTRAEEVGAGVAAKWAQGLLRPQEAPEPEGE